jgi:hypothetical protein
VTEDGNFSACYMPVLDPSGVVILAMALLAVGVLVALRDARGDRLSLS